MIALNNTSIFDRKCRVMVNAGFWNGAFYRLSAADTHRSFVSTVHDQQECQVKVGL